MCTHPAGHGDPPCIITSAASGSDYLDSAWIRLGPERNAEWMLGTHRYSCPCYLGGCSTPCSHAPGTVERGAGTYEMTAGQLRLTIATRQVVAEIPERVARDWNGPESLSMTVCAFATCADVVFRPR